MSRAWLISAALLLLQGAAYAVDPAFVITPDHSDGVYKPSETVTWTVDVKGDRTGLTALPYKVKHMS